MNDFEELALRIRKDPNDLDAWKALLERMDTPEKKNDCQKQIDRILAKSRIPIICPQCGAGMNIYFAEPLYDKRAKCPYCGTEIDIPDSYSRTEKQVSRNGKLLPETEYTVYERRADGGDQSASINTNEIEKLIEEKGLTEASKELEARGITDLKIHQIAGGDESGEINSSTEKQTTDYLKSKDIIFVGSKQLNRSIMTFQILITVAIIVFLLIGFFSQIIQVLNFIYRLPK